MRRSIVILMMMLATTARSQNRFSVEAGAGRTVFNVLNKNNNTDAHNIFTPTVEVNYMHQLNKWVSVGAKLAWQRYSFSYSYNKPTYAGIETEGAHTKANYLFLAPVLDMGIGKKQIVHAYVSPAAGYLLAGKQGINDFLYGSYNSDDKIEKFMFRLNLGLEEHVWKNANWHLVLNEGLSLISTPVSTLPTSKTDVRPGYVYVQIGLQKLTKPRKQQ